jgi:hypothetical protein
MMVRSLAVIYALALFFLAGYEVDTVIGHSPTPFMLVVVLVIIFTALSSVLVVCFPTRQKRRLLRKSLVTQRLSSRKRRSR